MRPRLAHDLERAVEAAAEAPRPFTAAVPLNRRAISQMRPLLLTLADDLRLERPIGYRGVAIVRQLLVDGYSPLYGSADPRQLEEELHRARAALRGV